MIPGLPLLLLTRANAAYSSLPDQFPPINCSELAGLSDLCFTPDNSVPPRELSGASLLPVSGKASDRCSWFFCRLSSLSCTAYSSLSLSSLPRTVWAFRQRFRLGLSVAIPFGFGVPHSPGRLPDLLCPLLTSVAEFRMDRSIAPSLHSQLRFRDLQPSSRGEINRLLRATAGFTTGAFDGYGLRYHELARALALH
jgi:hypothetical protein